LPPPLAPDDDEVQSYQRSRGRPPTGDLDSATLNTLTGEYLALLGPLRVTAERCTALGGGSSHPPLPLGDEDAPLSANPDSQFFVHPRRVEAFLFRERVTPPASTFKQAPAPKDPTYTAWCTRCAETLVAATGPLAIRVVGSAGAPLAGAQLAVFPLDGSETPEDGRALASATSDAAGVVRFVLPPAMYCVALVSDEGSRRLFCRVNRRFENLTSFEFNPKLRLLTSS